MFCAKNVEMIILLQIGGVGGRERFSATEWRCVTSQRFATAVRNAHLNRQVSSNQKAVCLCTNQSSHKQTEFITTFKHCYHAFFCFSTKNYITSLVFSTLGGVEVLLSINEILKAFLLVCLHAIQVRVVSVATSYYTDYPCIIS